MPETNKTCLPLRLLEHLAEGPAGDAEDLRRHLGLSPKALEQLTNDLASDGYVVRQDAGEHFQIGPRALHLGQKLTRALPEDVALRPVLRGLVDETGQTATLHRYDPVTRQGTRVAIVENANLIGYSLEVGETKSLTSGASGKGMLIAMSRDEIAACLAASDRADGTATALDAFLADLDAQTQDGTVVTRSERLPGAMGISAPVRDADGGVYGCIMITTPDRDLPETRMRALRSAVRAHAIKASSALGWAGPLEKGHHS